MALKWFNIVCNIMCPFLEGQPCLEKLNCKMNTVNPEVDLLTEYLKYHA